MSKSSISSIVLKILIVLLSLVLIFILSVPPEIWKDQEQAIAKERRHMSSIEQAETFFKKNAGIYSLDYDSISIMIHQDSSLNDRKNLAEATQGIYYGLKNILDNDLLTTLNLIASSYDDMVSDFEDPEKVILINRKIEGKEKLSANLKIAVDSLYHTLRSLPMLDEYKNVVATAKAAEDLNNLAKNIADEKLSTALLKSATLTDTLKILLQSFDAKKALEFFQVQVAPLVKNFSDLFFELELEKRSPFAERTISFQAQIEYALNQIIDSDYQRLYAQYNDQANLIEGKYNAYLSDYSSLLNRYSSLNVSEEDSLLLEFDPEIIESTLVPKQKIYVNFDSSSANLEIESPVLNSYAKEKSRPIAEGINSLRFLEEVSALISSLDSLQPVIDFNLDQLRHNITYREDRKKITRVTLELKTIPAVLKNFMKTPVINYGSDLILAVENLANKGRFSKIQDGLQNSYQLMNYFATIVDSNKVENVTIVLDDLLRDAANVDTMFAEIEFRRSKVEWRSLRSALQPAYEALQKVAKVLPEEHDKFLNIGEQATEVYQDNSSGITEYHYGIFPVSVKNPGFIENGKASWKDE